MTFNNMLHNMKHDKDPKQVLLDAIGNISGIRFSGYLVVVALYLRPQETEGGMLLSDQTRKEDEYQNKVGMVIKMAPLAFDGEEKAWDDDKLPQVGDWVLFRPMDGLNMQINGHPCKVFESCQIRGQTDNPDSVI